MLKRRQKGGLYEVAERVYNDLPLFTDIFDEESFYVFAFCFTVATILLAIILSRFVTIKPAYD